MAGAGISTSSGIPDFRTPGTGLYDNLKKYKIPYPTAIFDIDYFHINPKPFFCLAKELYPGNFKPNYVHFFLKLLENKGVLLRNWTQNIDGLERMAGVSGSKLVEAHGTFATASCVRCSRMQDPTRVKRLIIEDKIPRCDCLKRGVCKPDIVFFGEDLPPRFYSLKRRDFMNCDLLLVMGTSLEVEPFSGLVNDVRFSTPRVLFNRDVVEPFTKRMRRPTDVVCPGDITESVKKLIELAGWTKDMELLLGETTTVDEKSLFKKPAWIYKEKT
ncbi:NAD-dependent protein deacetylase sirtuin-3, mitochondrial-like isoform X2 [Oscarella lobularis]